MARTRGAEAREPDIRCAQLRPRERECAALVAEGLTNGEIAQHMGISVKSVENYMAQVYGYYEVDPAGSGNNRMKLVQVITDDMALSRIMGE